MMRRFVLEHPNLTFAIGFVLFVLLPFILYRTAKADNSQALQSDRNSRICIERNSPVYETYYRDGRDYTHTAYYDTTYREPISPRYYDYGYYDYSGSARPHGPAAWDTSGSAWGSGYDYYGYNSGPGPTPYPGPARPHGEPAW
jgi:hypothetical protein